MYPFMARPQTGHSVSVEHSFHHFRNSVNRPDDTIPQTPKKSGSRNLAILAILLISVSFLGTVGCGVNVRAFSTPAGNTSLVATPASVDFGSVSVGDSADQKLTLANNGSEAVQITTLNVSNSAFSVNGQGTLPVSLAAGKSLSINVHFSPKDSTDTSGQLSVNATSNTTTDLSSMIKLHGSGGKKGSLSNLSCANATMTGPGSDTCTVTLSSAAKGNQGIVGLESSSSTIKVPASVTV